MSCTALKKGATRGWPPARRRAQAARMRKNKPWLKSTGPRTCAGKARVRLNAVKHGRRRASVRHMARVLTAQRRYLKYVQPLLDPALSVDEFRVLRDGIAGVLSKNLSPPRRACSLKHWGSSKGEPRTAHIMDPRSLSYASLRGGDDGLIKDVHPPFQPRPFTNASTTLGSASVDVSPISFSS